MTTPRNLFNFLTDRLDEDEVRARDAYYEGQRWLPEEEAVIAVDDSDTVLSLDRKRDALHAARWSPDRVLAEVKAKRRIIGWARGWPMRPPNASDGIAAEDALLRILAQPYADHPDFDPEWKL